MLEFITMPIVFIPIIVGIYALSAYLLKVAVTLDRNDEKKSEETRRNILIINAVILVTSLFFVLIVSYYTGTRHNVVEPNIDVQTTIEERRQQAINNNALVASQQIDTSLTDANDREKEERAENTARMLDWRNRE